MNYKYKKNPIRKTKRDWGSGRNKQAKGKRRGSDQSKRSITEEDYLSDRGNFDLYVRSTALYEAERGVNESDYE